MEFTNSVAFLLLPLLVSCAAAQNIVEIHTRTLDSDRVGEIAPTLEIVNSNFDSCVITELGNPDREEFEAGQIDPFWEEMLQSCLGFPVSGGELPIFTVSLVDTRNSWQPDWFRIVLNDFSYLMCYDGQVLDEDNPTHDLTCAADTKPPDTTSSATTMAKEADL